VKRPIAIHIAGQRYLVRSDAEESYVQSLASTVDARVLALKGPRMVATQSDMVLAALQLADELQHERRRHRELMAQIAQRSRHMLDYLARVHPGPEGLR
jgi:cell division protein ZapA (FtsZ GTPase activity inhibitor)